MNSELFNAPFNSSRRSRPIDTNSHRAVKATLAIVAMALTMLFQPRVASAQGTVFAIRGTSSPSAQIGILSLDKIQKNGRRLFYATAQYPNALIQYTRLLVGAHGWPRKYLLQAGIQGQSIRIHVRITAKALTEEVSRGRTTKRYRFRLKEPVDLVDNNDLTGFQALLDRLSGRAIRGDKFRVFVPQAIAFGTLQVEKARQAKITIDRKRRTVQILRLRLQLRNQREPIQITSNPVTHRLLQFSQLRTFVRITAQPRVPQTHASYQHCADETTISALLDGKGPRSKLITPVVRRNLWPALLLIRSTPDLSPSDRWPWRTSMNGIDEELAKGLACRGIATLLLSGAPKQPDASPKAALIRNARRIAKGLTELANQPGIDPRRVFLAGNSIGGLLALYTLPGLNPRPSGLILIDTPGKPLQNVLTQSMMESARREGATARHLEALRASLTSYFKNIIENRGDRQQARLSPTKPFGSLSNTLLGAFSLRPAQLAFQAHTPMLIIQGGKDLLVMPDNARLLAKAAANAKRLNEANMTHSLVVSRLPPLSALLTHPEQPVDPALVRAIARWIGGKGIKTLKMASNRASY